MKSVYKLLIDIGPLAVFFIFYNRSGLQASILPFMLATVIAVLISYILEKKIARDAFLFENWNRAPIQGRLNLELETDWPVSFQF